MVPNSGITNSGQEYFPDNRLFENPVYAKPTIAYTHRNSSSDGVNGLKDNIMEFKKSILDKCPPER